MTNIKVKNLYKIFGKNPEKAINLLEDHSKEEILTKTGNTVGVNNVSFEVEQGEAFVVMGLSGSGKSTLIRCLNRLIEPTSGSMYINDQDVTKMDKKQLGDLRCGINSMIYQSFANFSHRTVIEYTAYGLKIMCVPQEGRLNRATESLKLVGLETRGYQYPFQLCGGM